MKNLLAISIFLFYSLNTLNAQKFTISGSIRDAQNGESLIGVNIFVKNTTTGVISNPYGFYSLSLPKGEYQIVASYLGYMEIDTLINLNSNLK
ncbi:MAG: carboxypeptidase-like regulatory domain-containing protein, partial [Bacteroidales bacterium]|nr:carboxypeptidase-like regulatory domain-containing protein [Bacteroidales bacterium]